MYWDEVGIVDMKKVKSSEGLNDFHTHLTSRILGLPSAKEVFDCLSISGEDIQNLGVKTMMMLSKDDPIVSYSSMPLDAIKSNPNINLYTTEKGAHLCWF